MAEFLVETYRILSLTDWDAYDELTGPMTTTAKTLLWDMFPEGTITGNAFRDVGNGLVVPPDIEVE